MAVHDLGVVSSDPKILKRCEDLSSDFGFSTKVWPNSSAFTETCEECKFIIADASASHDKTLAAELAQIAKFSCPESYVLCITSKKLDNDAAVFLKRSGANAVLIDDELFMTSKLELAATQTIKAEYLAVKHHDLTAERQLAFDLFHFLPLRGKFLRCAGEGDLLTQSKLNKLATVGEIYIRKIAAPKFAKYSYENTGLSPEGLARRSRANYLALFSAYIDLAFLLTDQSEYASYAKGEALLERLRALSKELLQTLLLSGDPGSIINSASIGETGSCERAPAVAAYVGLYGAAMKLDGVEDAMLGALLADLGMLMLPPDVTRILRRGNLSEMTAEQRGAYRSYPLKSLDIILGRRLALNEEMRTILTTVHERADGKGFPKGLLEKHLPLASQLIQFCKVLDAKTVVRPGQERPSSNEICKQMANPEILFSGMISPILGAKLKPLLENPS